MKADRTKSLKIKLKEADADNFVSALKKITTDEKSVGFQKFNFTDDEAKCLKDLSDKLK